MNETIVAAAVMPVPAPARRVGWPVLNPYNTSLKSRDSRIIAFLLFLSSVQSEIAGAWHFSGTYESCFPNYIWGADNSHINERTVVM